MFTMASPKNENASYAYNHCTWEAEEERLWVQGPHNELLFQNDSKKEAKNHENV